MARPTTSFRCTECGWTTPKWAGRCGECQQWGTVVEAGPAAVTQRTTSTLVADARIARPITQIAPREQSHTPTGIGEFDRVLGGGVVPGAAILLSGEPGVGKSTLLLEVASRAAQSGQRVLYVSAEESTAQVRLRAGRTGRAAATSSTSRARPTSPSSSARSTRCGPRSSSSTRCRPSPHRSSTASRAASRQVKEVAATLIRVAKERDLPVLLVGHVTKDGTIAGPRMLEHLVDVVCQFEGDRQTALRFVRAHKNRFGPTDEVGCFEMTGEGIAEVADPSVLFRSNATVPVSGTCVAIAMEGRRAIPVEVQALIVASKAPQPRRVVNGVDSSRVAMLLAVLERRCGMPLSEFDVYVSTVGGIRLTEPGADLAIALAIASARREKALDGHLAAIGEISLAGEIRAVAGAPQRAAEARRLGYRTLIDAGAVHVREAVRLAFASARDEKVDVPEF